MNDTAVTLVREALAIQAPEATTAPPVPTADLLDYSNWSVAVRKQMLQALQRRQEQDTAQSEPTEV
jgi:hypothetical protein